MRYDGIAASPGIAVGPIFCYQHEEYAVRDTPVAPERVGEEIERFHRALAAARKDLARLRDGIAAELGELEAAIYDTHLMILDDPELLKAVEEGIRREGRNTAWIFRGYMSAAAARLGQVQDEYLRERRADLVDVERRVLRQLLEDAPRALDELPQPSVVMAHDLGPSEVAVLKPGRVLGFVTEVGGRTSHSAIVARGRGIPTVVGVRGVLQHARTGDLGAVDGYAGQVEVNPDEETAGRYRQRQAMLESEARALVQLKDEPAVTLDGRTVELGANIELPGEEEQALEAGADGIGLFRTEFFYLGRFELPTEEEQYVAYRGVTERMAPRPVIFRTMDLGGDKVASYLGASHETNPFLGWRGIRFALHHPDVFRTQIRAIYRASAHGRVRMMFPMVSNLDELLSTTRLCVAVQAELERKGVPHDPQLEIGLMIETPSSVWIADVLARHARFFSIGSNDLVQYTLAIDRDNERLSHLYEPLEPAVLRSIHHTIAAAHAAGRWVGICGEMAGDPRTAVLLLGLGVDELSMTCFDLPRVKAAIRSVRYDQAREAALAALEETSAAGVKALMRDRLESHLPSFLVAKRSPL
ncbi:MAG: phosphoenolpyruvate--protein phosphotransferase [Candidatus Eisenbacteria bacterium RBG_16_71_46]|nr:MAG: phosphoenolpyruvate--protein phosphotransferase [Candidatus Eisenbacteria bacterium RBG_16_71_46]